MEKSVGCKGCEYYDRKSEPHCRWMDSGIRPCLGVRWPGRSTNPFDVRQLCLIKHRFDRSGGGYWTLRGILELLPETSYARVFEYRSGPRLVGEYTHVERQINPEKHPVLDRRVLSVTLGEHRRDASETQPTHILLVCLW